MWFWAGALYLGPRTLRGPMWGSQKRSECNPCIGSSLQHQQLLILTISLPSITFAEAHTKLVRSERVEPKQRWSVQAYAGVIMAFG